VSVRTVSPEQFETLRLQNPSVALIDVRTPLEYRTVHAEPARLIPLDQLNPGQLVESRNGNGEEPIYFICKSGARAAKACERMEAAGFGNSYSIDGGTEAWERAGLPVVRGKAAVSLERQVRIVAGSLVLVGLALGWFVHPYLYALSAFIGAGLVFAGVTDWCGMGMLLARMPWNR
jgi:rhodanese-related sulfurtransferase